jgi:predicted nucleic acid-binding protein
LAKADDYREFVGIPGWHPIPINDVWIAASCLEHGAALITRDAHFSEIDGLRTL